MEGPTTLPRPLSFAFFPVDPIVRCPELGKSPAANLSSFLFPSLLMYLPPSLQSFQKFSGAIPHRTHVVSSVRGKKCILGLSLSGEQGHKKAEVESSASSTGEGSQPRTEANALTITCCLAHAHSGVLGYYILTAPSWCGTNRREWNSPPEGMEAFPWNS